MTGYEYGKSNPALQPGTGVRPRRRVVVPPIITDLGHVVDPGADVTGMSVPVRCACGEVYDLGRVTVTQRYADCSMWITPCCRREVDDRTPWPGHPAPFRRLGVPR